MRLRPSERAGRSAIRNGDKLVAVEVRVVPTTPHTLDPTLGLGDHERVATVSTSSEVRRLGSRQDLKLEVGYVGAPPAVRTGEVAMAL